MIKPDNNKLVQAETLAVERLPDGRWAYGRMTIMHMADVTLNQARKAITRARKTMPQPAKSVCQEVIREASPYQVIPAAPAPSSPVYDTLADAFKAFIGASVPAFNPAMGCATNEHIAVFSDIHAPWHDHAALVQACDEAVAAGCTTVIVAGDFFEYHRISRHHKSKACTFEEELAGCRLAAEYVASRFPVRKYFRGNHEDRWQRYIGENVEAEIQFLVPDVTHMILGGLGYEFIGHKATLSAGPEELVWLAQIGKDAILTHCQLSSAAQGFNLERLKQWLREWGSALGFTDAPRFVQTGHTHRGTDHHEWDRLLCESGTLASLDIQNYQFKSPGGAQLTNRKPGTLGWVLLVQRDGRTDLKESGFRRLTR